MKECTLKGCMKDLPCHIKLAYLLIAILFVLQVFTLVSSKKSSGNVDLAQWINNNPEAILESVNNYVMKQQEEQMKKQQEQSGENIVKFEKELKDTKYAGVINPKGTVEIIEFYDYNCGYCKVAAKNVEELLQTRKDVKVILRSIPILGEPSRYATEVGTAILMSNATKYPEYYKALMNSSARSKQDIEKAVKSIGLNMQRLEAFISKNKEEIGKAIQSNMELAQKVGINGTPAFIINGELIPGAVDANTLNQVLSK